jgi:cytochrome c-type biogenesis protein CcmH
MNRAMNTSPKTLVRTLLATLLLALAGAALAIDTERAFEDPALQARYEQINRELRCLVCQNQTIADSNATLAGDLRREVREMIAAGKTDDEIREFMIARYGDFVLYRPRMTATNFLLWAAPVLLLALGGFIGIRYVRRQAAEVDSDSPEAGQS